MEKKLDKDPALKTSYEELTGEEKNPQVVATLKVIPQVTPDPKRFSDWTRLLRSTARIFQFIDLLRETFYDVRLNRRSLYTREWQYEGLPIEFPNRRSVQKVATYDETTTTTANPPIDPRYRRVYNPDEVASVVDHPFMAALLVNKQLWCGAVIIDRDTVLTAAHCLQLQYNNRFFREYVKMLSVRVGSTNATAGGEVLRVVEIFFHPNYKPQTLEFNFAVVKLHKNMTFGRHDLIADMVPYSKIKVVPVDNVITFLGWGSVLVHGGNGGSVLLQKVELPVYDLADCQEVYGRNLVSRNNFCAGYITIPKNVCNHDAGGPAIMDGQLVGILSFSSKRCDQPDHPAVFSTVGVIAPWLEKLGEKKVQLRNSAIKSPEAVHRQT
ncbi:trypsin-7-like [Ostrinia furnacalis]|uniref:trypsin-7-like n=1 Tax=Ostrinia furnacalis TaxID=93504 RepID=UPI00103E8AD1|nr:trypsin-7-like [Ostrinia furnacalis]